MRVFMTGSSGHLASVLLPRLCADPAVEHVRGIDLKVPRFRHPRFEAIVADTRDPALPGLLDGCDSLVHLAFVVLRGRMPASVMREINVEGTRAVFRAARRAGLRRLIHLSSAAVYGSGSDIPEDAPLAPLRGFLYASHKAEVESMLEREYPEAVRLRPHAILGPDAQPLLLRLLRQPCYLRHRQGDARLQCVHEDDVADAVLLALARDVRGPFNLAAHGSFSFAEAIRRRRRLSLGLPPRVARAGVGVAWRVFGWGGEPAWIDGLSRTLTLDCARARAELGWHPQHGIDATLAAALA